MLRNNKLIFPKISDKDNREIIAKNMKSPLGIPNKMEMIFDCEEYSNLSVFIDIDKGLFFSFTDKIGDDQVDFYVTCQDHIDIPDVTRYAKIEHRRFIKERAANSDDKPRKILNLAERPQCLAYLPIEDVVSGFEELKESHKTILMDQRLADFYDYVEQTYVVKYGITRGRYNKKINTLKDAMFNISLWNVNDRVTKDLPKTNNYCESWHNSFTGILNTHPLIYELIDKLRNEQNRTEKN
ncbi:unnamed protein product [Brachionus calyciflorus]|uniref:Uncharacterized protein n=1 Tax=Brachionus calyciflorus TaxID=104777 RepID=A0A814LZI2_9BILA|nr:unnamed protein product [Brachionus calyciflorus]